MSEQERLICELYNKYYALLKNYCISLFHYDPSLTALAEDCVQDAFYKALTHPEDILKAPNPCAWLVKCCKNNCYAVLRRKVLVRRLLGKPIPLEENTEIQDVTDSLIRWLCQYQAMEQLKELQASLTPLEKSVFDSYYLNNMSVAETAEYNGIAFYSVKGALDRIRSKAKKIKIENNFPDK